MASGAMSVSLMKPKVSSSFSSASVCAATGLARTVGREADQNLSHGVVPLRAGFGAGQTRKKPLTHLAWLAKGRAALLIIPVVRVFGRGGPRCLPTLKSYVVGDPS